jgi:hypothetical protein
MKRGDGLHVPERIASPNGELQAMGQASFHIHRDHGSWVVVEESSGHEIGGIFKTLVAALDFVDGEARRFLKARAVIELSPRADRRTTRLAS